MVRDTEYAILMALKVLLERKSDNADGWDARERSTSAQGARPRVSAVRVEQPALARLSQPQVTCPEGKTRPMGAAERRAALFPHLPGSRMPKSSTTHTL